MLTCVSASGVVSTRIDAGVRQTTIRRQCFLAPSVRLLCSPSSSTHLILYPFTSRKKRKLSFQREVGSRKIEECADALVVLLDELQESVSQLVNNTYDSIERVRDEYAVT